MVGFLADGPASKGRGVDNLLVFKPVRRLIPIAAVIRHQANANLVVADAVEGHCGSFPRRLLIGIPSLPT